MHKQFATLNEMIGHNVATLADVPFLTFLPNGELTEQMTLTFRELDARARQLGALLQAHNAAQAPVVLATSNTIDFSVGFLACLYAGAIAVPVPAPNQGKVNAALRLESIIADAKPALMLTSREQVSAQASIIKTYPELHALTWIDISNRESQPSADAFKPATVIPETIAFLQYTSGSTSAPRGVMVTHTNLLHNLSQIQQSCEMTRESVLISWMPLYHDYGLIFILLEAFSLGMKCVHMPPLAFAQKPWRWLQAISHFKGTITAGPNFAFDLCVKKIPESQRAELDLSSLQGAFNGSEPVRQSTIERFNDAFKTSQLSPGAFRGLYGLAEATVFVSTVDPSVPLWDRSITVDERALAKGRIVEVTPASLAFDIKKTTLVACGSAGPDMEIAIVSPQTGTLSDPMTVGEVWVKGPNVSAGYAGREEASQATFHNTLPGREGRYLRTGDLGFIHNGQLYLNGRCKDLIIFRGNNYYPQDLEESAELACSQIRPGFTAAFSVDADDSEQLIMVAEINEDTVSADVANQIFKTIRATINLRHEIDPYGIVLIKKGTMSKTSSGKIQRQPCKRMFLANELEIVASNLKQRSGV